MTEEQLLAMIRADEDMMTILTVISELNLSDCWLAAGLIRNAVWNILSNHPAFDRETDVDVVYFDTQKDDKESLLIQKQLLERFPHYRWEVKNQVVMHQHSPNTSPYQSARDAIRKYPEKCTAIAVRLKNEKLELYAPYGLDDIVNFRVSPTPHFLADKKRMAVYHCRQVKKNWQEKWPRLSYDPTI